jgi:glycosyltransferase involved in cell wall biosynthesis
MNHAKILYVIDAYQTGGAERFLVNLLSGMGRRKEFRESICTLREPGFVKRLIDAGIEVVSLSRMRGPGYGSIGSKYQGLLRGLPVLLLLPKLIHFLKKADQDIVVSIGYPASIMISFASIILRRSVYIYRVAVPRGKLIPSERILMGWVFSRYSTLICVSEAVRESVLAQFPELESRCIVIHNGVLVPPVPNIPRGRVRLHLGINTDSVIFVNTGRFIPNKGQLELIEAFELVRAKNPKSHLLLAGDGPLWGLAKQKIIARRLMDCVHLLGNRDEVQEIIACGDVFVFPSIREGFSNAILEAMANSLPIVAYNIPSVREIVENHVTGILVPEHDTRALAEAMLILTSDQSLRREMGRQAREKVERGYTVDMMRRSYDKVFCQTLGIAGRRWSSRKSEGC